MRLPLSAFAILVSTVAFAQVLDVNEDSVVGPHEALAVAKDWKGPAVGGVGNGQFVRNFTVAPGESVAAGDVVAFIGGTVRKGTWGVPTLRPVFESSYAPGMVDEYLDVLSLSANRFVVAYAVGNSGVARVGEVIGSVVAYGPVIEFSSTAVRDIAIAQLGTNRFVVAYEEQSGAGIGRVRFANVDGETIQFEEKYTFNPNGTTDISVIGVNNTTCAVAYRDDGDNGNGNAQTVGRNLLDQMSAGPKATFSSVGEIVHTSLARVSGAKQISFPMPQFVVAVSRFDPQTMSANVAFSKGDISGIPIPTNITFGPETLLPGASNPIFANLARLNGNRLLAIYAGIDTQIGFLASGVYLRDLTVVGDTFTFGAPLTLTGQTFPFSDLETTSSTEFTLAYTEVVLEVTQVQTVVQLGHVVDQNLELGSAAVLSASPPLARPQVTSLPVGYAYLASAPINEGFGGSLLSEVGTLSRAVGIARESASGGQSVEVTIPGISDVHSGLLVGAYYYANGEGVLVTRPTDTPIGIAVSPSEVVLTGGIYGPQF
jgi:hypothetical protein